MLPWITNAVIFRWLVRGSKLAKLLLQLRGLRHSKRNKRCDEVVDGRPQRGATAEADRAARPDGLHEQAPTAAHTVINPQLSEIRICLKPYTSSLNQHIELLGSWRNFKQVE